MQKETIEISHEWWEKLTSIPFVSCKNHLRFNFSCIEHKGKTLHLLKQKAKEVPQQRKRRKLTVYGEGVEERK